MYTGILVFRNLFSLDGTFPFWDVSKGFPWESLVENRNVMQSSTVPAGLSDVYLNLSNTHSVQSLMYLQSCTAAADT